MIQGRSQGAMPARVLCLSVLLIFAACGKQQKANDDPNGLLTGSIIIDDLDWESIVLYDQDDPKRVNASFVADVDLPISTRCTGFLISEDVVMTNQHCIPSERHAKNLTLTFDHVEGVPDDEQVRFNCGEFIGNDRTLDYALLRCEGSPGLEYGFATLSTVPQQEGQDLYIVQQNCDYYTSRGCDFFKRISHGEIIDNSREYTHNADTLGGSSGSPVFSEDSNNVIAIHHAGFGNDGRGRGIENYAVPMHQIVANIQSRFPNVQLSLDNGGNPSPDPGPDPIPDSDNHSFDDALKIEAGHQSQNEIDDLNEDYFKVVLSKLTDVRFTVNFIHSQGDIDIRLYDSSESVIARSASFANFEQIEERLWPGTYYLKVYGYRGQKNSYDLSFSEQNSWGILRVGDSLENSLKSNQGRSVHPFFLEEDSDVEIRLAAHRGSSNLDLYLYNEDEELIDYSRNWWWFNDVIDQDLSVGAYYIVVQGATEGASGNYTLSIR